MRVAGVSVSMQPGSRPKATVAVVDGSWAQPVLHERFELTSSQDDLATQLSDLGAGLRSRLSGLGVDRVVIRRADKSPRPSDRKGPKVRLLAEGALTFAAKEECSDVWLSIGKDLASGSPAGGKDALSEYAKTAGADFGDAAAEAALAGLA